MSGETSPLRLLKFSMSRALDETNPSRQFLRLEGVDTGLVNPETGALNLSAPYLHVRVKEVLERRASELSLFRSQRPEHLRPLAQLWSRLPKGPVVPGEEDLQEFLSSLFSDVPPDDTEEGPELPSTFIALAEKAFREAELGLVMQEYVFGKGLPPGVSDKIAPSAVTITFSQSLETAAGSWKAEGTLVVQELIGQDDLRSTKHSRALFVRVSPSSEALMVPLNTMSPSLLLLLRLLQVHVSEAMARLISTPDYALR